MQGPTPWLCVTCGVEHAAAHEPPARCDICEDERQYVPADGQRWTTLDALRADGRTVDVVDLGDDLWGVVAEDVGIGQQAALVRTTAGNVLFDPPSLIDDAAVEAVRAVGGLEAIVASHPHMYGVQSAWSAAFDDATIWVAEADEAWLRLRTPAMRTWHDAFEVLPGIVLDQIGGHFPGSTIAHWRDGAGGRGVLLAGDGIFPVVDGGVTFLRSYPNRIPLSGPVVTRIAARVARYSYDELYGNFGDRVGPKADRIVQESARRYAAWASGANDHLT